MLSFKIRLAGLVLQAGRVFFRRAGFQVDVDSLALGVSEAIVDTEIEGLCAPKLALVLVTLNHFSLGGSQRVKFVPILIRANL